MTWFSGEIEGGSVVVNRVQRGGCRENWLSINCDRGGGGEETIRGIRFILSWLDQNLQTLPPPATMSGPYSKRASSKLHPDSWLSDFTKCRKRGIQRVVLGPPPTYDREILKAHSPSAGLSSGTNLWSPPSVTGTCHIITRNHYQKKKKQNSNTSQDIHFCSSAWC